MKDQFKVWRFVFNDKGGEHPEVLIFASSRLVGAMSWLAGRDYAG